MADVTLLLPGAARLAGALPADIAAMLGRADCIELTTTDERSQLLRHFQLRPPVWPIAAITRQADAGDAGSDGWLRADPAWVRAEMNGARLFAFGEGLHVTQADVDALLPALRPLFGDAGFELDAPVPSRWYLRVARETRLPVSVDPDVALGADLGDYLTDAEADQSVIRRWRALLNDAQIALHAHPHNERRIAAGQPPINSLWFWGGGCFPDAVSTRHSNVCSSERTLTALALAAGAVTAPLPGSFRSDTGHALVDLRGLRSVATLSQDWLVPAFAAIRQRQLETVTLDLADGAQYAVRRRQRWRPWRKPLLRLYAPTAAAPIRGRRE